MKKIPFEEALAILTAAYDIAVVDTPCTVKSFIVQPFGADEDNFLEITADDGDGQEYNWAFYEVNNAEVTVDADLMTLVAVGDDHNDLGPIQIQLLMPMRFEPVREVTCVYCGRVYPDGTPTHQNELLTEHIKVCEKHPMRQVEAGYKELSERLSRIQAFAAGLDQRSDPIRRGLLGLVRGFDEHDAPLRLDLRDDVCKNNHKGSEESEAAHRVTNKERDAKAILTYLATVKDATCDEIEVALNLRHQTASARWSDLKKAGMLVATTQRKTRANCLARAYRLKHVIDD